MNKKISFEIISVYVDDILKLNINKGKTKKILIGYKKPIKIVYPEFCVTNTILDNNFWKKELINKNNIKGDSSIYINKNSNKYDNFRRIIDNNILEESK